jgi:N-acetyl-gamma-glutamyl-phosphate reductase common form
VTRLGREARVGVVGARGHVGSELLPILARHPAVELAWATSSSAAGAPVPGFGPGVTFRAADPALLETDRVDALLLALPNGEAAAWASRAGDAVVIDLSADHRFDASWVYGQPERFRARMRGAKRIASPGCYATAAQLAAAPLLARVEGSVHAFGVSGYSGAGTARSERNDPEVLRDNLVPYALVGHTHEKELRAHGVPAYFAPHVASFFRGLVVTVSMKLAEPASLDELSAEYRRAYEGEPFVELAREAPRPRDSVGSHGVRIGGLSVGDGGTHAVVVAALDNLLGGAASQAVRALNLALGLSEDAGLRP